MLKRLKKHRAAIVIAAVLAGCTPLALPGLYGQWSIGCLLGACTCIRAVVRASVPSPITSQNIAQYQNLTPFFATDSNGGYVHVVGDPILGLTFLNFSGHWFPSSFFVRNRYGNYLMRSANGAQVRTNNYMGFYAATQLLLPPELAHVEGQRVRIVAIKAAGGVRVDIKRPEDLVRHTIIDSDAGRLPGGEIARTMVCSNQEDEITASTTEGTELYLYSNMSDGNNVEHDSSVGHGAYGSLEVRLALIGGPLNPGGGINQGVCGQEIYRTGTGYPPVHLGATTFDQLEGLGFWNLPTAVYQPTEEHQAAYGLPICPFEL